MSDLIVYDESRQSLGEVAFIKSVVKHKKIRNISDSYTISKEISHWITQTTNLLGIKDAVPTHNKTEITELILSVFKNLSFDELYYAFKMERFGVLGEKTQHYQLFDASYVSDILNKYKNWRIEVRRKHNLSIAKPKEENGISEQEKLSIVSKGILNLFEHFKEHGDIPPGNLYVYEVLYEDGFLPTDPETKRQVYEEAKQVLEFELQNKKALTQKEKDEYLLIKKAIESKHHPRVVIEAKMISIKKFFRSALKDEKAANDFKTKYQKRILTENKQ